MTTESPQSPRRCVPATMQGRTLVEIAVAMAAVAAIGAVAYPAYSNYVLRSRWANVVAAMRGVEVSMHECLTAHGAAGCN